MAAAWLRSALQWRPAWWCGSSEEDLRPRLVHLNQPKHDAHDKYDGNLTRTTRYTLLTYLPVSLFEQYRRLANIYFTIVAALSLTKFSPVRPWTTWVPLIIVLGVSMVKEGIEDYRRHRADKEVNNRPVEALDTKTGTFKEKPWRKVMVGEILRTRKDETFASDVLFLGADSPEGTCYVETMNLDGETNLKIKKCMEETKHMGEAELATLTGMVECEPPNSRLYQFTGNLVLGDEEEQDPLAKIPISPAQVILRGCSLRNTPHAYGVVVYAGHDTKVFKNATKPPSKRSFVEKATDKIILLMFSILMAMVIVSMVYLGIWVEHEYEKNWYLASFDQPSEYDPDRPATAAWTQFVTAFILYGYLIPISLYVSIEIVKVAQSVLYIGQDREMYHKDTDTPALARTSNLNEELGMVSYVLSDKTGTLTRNVMEFFKASIGGVSYGAGITEVEQSNALRRGEALEQHDTSAGAKYRQPYFNFYDSRLMDGAWQQEPDPQRVEMFFRLLAVCHTVIPSGPQNEKDIKYEAESPDEAALVVSAKVMGFFFYARTSTHVKVRENTLSGTQDVVYEVLNILEFSSARKRMSIIVRDSNGRLLIFTKGADTVIYERLNPKDPQNQKLKSITTQHMEEYGSAGLRTLCLAYAELDPSFYAGWQTKFMEAKTSMEGRDEKVAAVGELIEKDLVLLGCTAIEDKLQEGVPLCIKTLAAAGIKLWVLTGDKLETAINIAFACSLITEEMQQFVLDANCPEVEELEAAGEGDEADIVANSRMQKQLTDMEATMALQEDAAIQYALVIDGKSLSYALSDKLAPVFLRVGVKCAAVVCCRVSPLQKAQVTTLVSKAGDLTLAIGDGANDVGMIQAAHLGVGISGQEGMQAVMASDFAIAQFRFLTPLLLVHGRFSYCRLTRMISFFLYKNLLFGLTIFIFNAFALFSGQYMYNDFYMTLFNILFTSLIPLAIGIFDRDVDRKQCVKFPSMYKQGPRNDNFNLLAIGGWLVLALYQAGIIMTFIMIGQDSKIVSRYSGQTYSMFESGVCMFTIVILVVHIEAMQVEEHWQWPHHVAVWISIGIWFVYLLAYGAFPIEYAQDLYYMFIGVVATNGQYWFFVLLVPAACILPSLFFRSMRRLLYPSVQNIVQEMSSMERKDQAQTLPELEEIKSLKPEPVTRNTGFVPPYDRNSRSYRAWGSLRKQSSTARSHTLAAPTEFESQLQLEMQERQKRLVEQHELEREHQQLAQLQRQQRAQWERMRQQQGGALIPGGGVLSLSGGGDGERACGWQGMGMVGESEMVSGGAAHRHQWEAGASSSGDRYRGSPELGAGVQLNPTCTRELDPSTSPDEISICEPQYPGLQPSIVQPYSGDPTRWHMYSGPQALHESTDVRADARDDPAKLVGSVPIGYVLDPHASSNSSLWGSVCMPPQQTSQHGYQGGHPRQQHPH